jgi:hypothetical protein
MTEDKTRRAALGGSRWGDSLTYAEAGEIIVAEVLRRRQVIDANRLCFVIIVCTRLDNEAWGMLLDRGSRLNRGLVKSSRFVEDSQLCRRR